MTREILNTKAIQHMSSNGTTFKADRGDLQSGVRVLSAWNTSLEHMMSDFAEFGAWHLMNIHPSLHGFGGYDTITYTIERDK
jgi:hypothetical protein